MAVDGSEGDGQRSGQDIIERTHYGFLSALRFRLARAYAYLAVAASASTIFYFVFGFGHYE